MASLTRPDAPARRPRPPVVRRSSPSPRITRGWAGLTTAAYPRAGAATAICLGIVATHGGALTPVAVLIALAAAMVQFRRMINEEAILQATFPDYRLYAAKTSFLIPTKLGKIFQGSNAK